ncbi:MAG: hypothetical protein RIT26_1709 [Pseudomonadota bacterium]|jgi:hypothetical protein
MPTHSDWHGLAHTASFSVEFCGAARVLLRLKELLPGDHELRTDIATWYRAVAGNSSIVAPLLDELVNPKGDAVTLA